MCCVVCGAVDMLLACRVDRVYHFTTATVFTIMQAVHGIYMYTVCVNMTVYVDPLYDIH